MMLCSSDLSRVDLSEEKRVGLERTLQGNAVSKKSYAFYSKELICLYLIARNRLAACQSNELESRRDHLSNGGTWLIRHISVRIMKRSRIC